MEERIHIPLMNDPPKPHEIHTAEILAKFGHRIDFIKPKNTPSIKSCDLIIDGNRNTPWEVKAPIKGGKYTIHNLFRDAKSQSTNIIFDLYRANSQDSFYVKRILFEFKNYKSIQRIKIITRKTTTIETDKIIDINR